MPVDIRLMAKLAVRHALVTPEQLADCLRAPIAQRGMLGEVMMQRGLISAEQLAWLKQQCAEQGGAQTPAPSKLPAPEPRTQKPSSPQLAPLDFGDDTPLEIDRGSLPAQTARAAYRVGHRGGEGADDAPAASSFDSVKPPAARVVEVPPPRAPSRPQVVVPPPSRPQIAVPPARAEIAAPPQASRTPSRPRLVVPPPEPLAPAREEPPARVEAPRVEAVEDPRARNQPSPRAPEVEALLAEGVRRRASDIHLHTTLPPLIRIDGVLQPLPNQPALTAARTEALLHAVMTPWQRQRFLARNDLDFAYSVPGLGRFRGNAYRQQRGLDLVFRAIPPEPPTLSALGLPESLAKFTTYHQGLVLCTGPAGCGKSSTMAALLDRVNSERNDHIITIEDPIEFVHASKKCLVRQRQVVSHTESFARALRAALREDPDVIGIGELRDLETIQLALSAAETGHLVIGTLHTNNAIRTINRILDAFPPEQQGQIRVMFSESLRGVISQKLVRRADGKGRVPALEVLMVTPAVANLIRDEKQFQIRSVMQMGRSHGMRLLDDSLKDLVAAGTVTQQEARLHADVSGALG